MGLALTGSQDRDDVHDVQADAMAHLFIPNGL